MTGLRWARIFLPVAHRGHQSGTRGEPEGDQRGTRGGPEVDLINGWVLGNVVLVKKLDLNEPFCLFLLSRFDNSCP